MIYRIADSYIYICTVPLPLLSQTLSLCHDSDRLYGQVGLGVPRQDLLQAQQRPPGEHREQMRLKIVNI